jgi:hypothetical protein
VALAANIICDIEPACEKTICYLPQAPKVAVLSGSISVILQFVILSATHTHSRDIITRYHLIAFLNRSFAFELAAAISH